MFRRSPQQALARDASNVSFIRTTAKKYGISEGASAVGVLPGSPLRHLRRQPYRRERRDAPTNRTGRGLGFDRDINEQNVEGGVKLLSQAVKKCGGTNYACLASYYNGSTAVEQANWSAGVGRRHDYFNDYAGSGKAPPPCRRPFSVRVSSAGATGAAQTGGGRPSTRRPRASNRAVRNDRSIPASIDTLAAGVGTTDEYLDAWDENSTARGLNADLLNQLVQGLPW